jgi:hypothetical protein
MAVTDEQLQSLVGFAKDGGRQGLLDNPSEHEIIEYVFEWAEKQNMRTEDEYDEIITPEDMPSPEDWNDIIAAWEEGAADYARHN